MLFYTPFSVTAIFLAHLVTMLANGAIICCTVKALVGCAYVLVTIQKEFEFFLSVRVAQFFSAISA